MDDSAEETLVDWREWGADAFAAADRTARPVLLSLSAPWCEACREMDRETYAEPHIAAHLSESFVPVRVDVDRHPRVRERYNMGGFPSTVFCTPDGRIMTGAGYMSPDGFRQALDSVRRTWDAKGAEAGRVPRALQDPEPPSGQVTAEIEAHFVEQVAAAFDEEFGGWGEDAKFPLPRTIEFAAKRDRDRATRTLEAVRTHLYDTYDGGFYRYATNRNWGGEIHREKLLDENAALVRAFATGYLYTGEDAYRETAEGAVEYLTTDLWTGGASGAPDGASGARSTGGRPRSERGRAKRRPVSERSPRAAGDAFAGSQAGGDYFTLEPSDREAAEPPHVDETVYADRNGLAADALFRLGAYTDDGTATRYAERALDHVLDELVDGGTVTHFDDPSSETGLLFDQARVLGALTAAAQSIGRFLDEAEQVADETLDLRAADGAFLDGPAAGPGLLDRPLRPLDANVELADALLDLWALSGDERYREAAGDALAAFAGAHDRMGAPAAAYGAACARYHYRPLVVETPPAGSDLHRAAWRIADHEKVVVPGDRDDAVVIRGGERSEPAETPDELVARAAGDEPAA